MRQTIIIIPFLILCIHALHAQDNTQPVEEKFIIPISLPGIQKAAADETAYGRLLSEFESGGEALGLFDIATLYYGWAFRPGYKGNLDAEQSPVERLMYEGDFQRAWDEGQEYLRDNPVSLITLQYLLHIGTALGRPDTEIGPLSQRMNKLLQTIYHTGNGYGEGTAYKVISVSDEHIFMKHALGVTKTAGRYLTSTWVDRFDVVTATNFDKRYLYMDASLAHHFGPKWEPEVPAEGTEEKTAE